jgi:hypothetical protein
MQKQPSGTAQWALDANRMNCAKTVGEAEIDVAFSRAHHIVELLGEDLRAFCLATRRCMNFGPSFFFVGLHTLFHPHAKSASKHGRQ